MTAADLFALKMDPILCTYVGNCWLSLDTSTVADMAGNLFQGSSSSASSRELLSPTRHRLF